MKIGYLGAGTWGTALAILLSNNGHEVIVWDHDTDLSFALDTKRVHPKLKDARIPKDIVYVSEMEKAVEGVDMIVESVSSAGIRCVFEKLVASQNITCPIVLTSKGIEQKTGLLFPELLLEILGEENKKYVCAISGPSHAEEVVRNLPTSVVVSSFDEACMKKVAKAFNNDNFRIYPNADIFGICFGGAMKNIIAIACGISDGLNFGDNAKAALMTRGLHEMRKLAKTKNCNPETLNGLSGLGDLFVTCASTLSRNYRFGQLIAKGNNAKKAKEKIGMAVEGAYTCVSAYDLGKKHHIPIPITQATYEILYKGLDPNEAVLSLMRRPIKKEDQ